MSNNEEKENLITVDEVIARCRKLGINLGKGNPRNRLRYYTKIGLLPYARRKAVNNKISQGVYPKSIIPLLVKIDNELKSGKSIQAIKREAEEENRGEKKREKAFFGKETRSFSAPTNFLKAVGLPFLIITILVSGLIIFSAIDKDGVDTAIKTVIKKATVQGLFASITGKIVSPPVLVMEGTSNTGETANDSLSFMASDNDSYLTINAETEINGPLKVNDYLSSNKFIMSPSFVITSGDFRGKLNLTGLSADRVYDFPNQSGVVCLSTGNCIGLAGEVVSSGETINRLAKFISPSKIGNSSIADTYEGVAITISPTGNVGIGTNFPQGKLDVSGEILAEDLFAANNAKIGKNLFVANNLGIGEENPKYPLYVKGKIQATGDICTDLKGGKCLSQLSTAPVFLGGGGGVGGSGTAGYLTLWRNSGSLTNSIVSQSGSTIDVAGAIKTTGFQLTTDAHQGYILTSDSSGIGTWQQAATGTLPVGSLGQTLRNDGTSWLPSSFLYNTGSAVGIGTTSTLATLTLAGSSYFQGPLTIATSTFPQLILKYDDTKTFGISVSSTGAVILDSSSGKIQLGPGDTLYTEGGNPIREKGEEIVRAVVPIFRYDLPSQTASTSFVRVSKYISDNSEISLPSSLDGTSRVYHLIIKYADDISTSSASSWRVINSSHTTTTDSFTLPGKGMSNLEESMPYITGAISIPDSDWQIEVKVPSGKKIRIFNIFLLATDEIE